MNANSYKVIFSKRLGTLVAVGEHTTSSGKSASGQACRGVTYPLSTSSLRENGFVGSLRLSAACVILAFMPISTLQAQSATSTVSASALPQAGSIGQGSATISANGAQMAIQQTTDKASINWQSFNIGSAASVNIAQPNASSVLLNRVVGNDPSQILGKLSANGQVILLNPNGILFGKDGSVTASAFTASTFGLSDNDFMAGYYKYSRNGSAASVVNQGTIQTTPGGFVALIGATVSNEGKIIAPQGDVVLAAGEQVTLPQELTDPKQLATANTISVRMSKRVRLEIDAAAINTAVSNTNSGVIVTEGGQVLLQAAALSTAVATVTQSGSIDTSAAQAGAVTVLAENGFIKVDGAIKANSNGDTNGAPNRGGNIIIGRDEETGTLAKATDVSGAQLESKHGFVETSGGWLSSHGTQVQAQDWLLDPYNITITSGTATGTSYASYTPGADSTILASDISANLNAGTNVSISTGTTGSAGSSDGNIVVNSDIIKSGANNAALTLNANNGITISGRIGKAASDTSSTGTLDVTLLANGAATNIANSKGISLSNVIHANGGIVNLTGINTSASGNGIQFNNGSGVNAATYTITGKSSNTTSGGNGVLLTAGSLTNFTSSTGASKISGEALNGSGKAILFGGASNGVNLTSNFVTGAGTLIIENTSNSVAGVRSGYNGGVILNTSGNVTIGSKDNNASSDALAGLFVQGTTINASSGSITLKGKSSNHGVIISEGGGTKTKINALGTTTVTIDAETTGSGKYGLSLGSGNAAEIYTENGNIAISSKSTDGDAIIMLNNSKIASTGSSANVTIAGTSNTQRGLNFASGTIASGGKTTLIATSVSGGTSLVSGTTGLIDATGGLDLDTNKAATLAGVISGGTNNIGGLTKLGAGTLTLSAANTLKGTTLVSTGTLALANLNALQSSTLDTGLSGTQVVSFTTSGTNTYNLGGLQGADALALGGNSISVGSTNSTTTFTGNITSTGTGSLTKVGTGNLTLTGTYSIAGDYNANGGTLTLTAPTNTYAALTNARVNINNGATVAIPSIVQGGFVSTNVIWTFDNAGGGNLNLAGNFVNRGLTGNKFVTTGGATNNLTGNINLDYLTNQAGLTFDIASGTGGTAGLIYSGNALNGSATQGFTKTGAGTLVLSGTNNVLAPIAVNAGTLQLGNGGTTGELGASSGAITLGASTMLTVNRSNAVTLGNTLTGAGSLTQAGTGTLTLTGNNNYTGTTTINASSTLQVGSGGATGNLGSGAITDNGTLTFNRDNTTSLVIDNAISGSGGINQAGTGTTVLNAANSYTGSTLVTSGTLKLGNSAAIGSGTLTVGTSSTSSASLDLAGFSLTKAITVNGYGADGSTGNVGALTNSSATASSLSGVITLASATSIGGTGAGGLTLSNNLAGAYGLKKVGSDTLTLTGLTNGTSTTTVDQGTLKVGNGGATGTLGSGNVTLNNSATLSYESSVATHIANNISGSGNVNATLTGVSSDLTVDHPIALTGGTVNLVTDGNLSVTQAISTTNATASAIHLEAGKSVAAGDATGGNVTISGAGSVAAGAAGRITIETGSMAGSTGLGIANGYNRYSSDEQSINYDLAALGAGKYAIYRESPSLAVTFNNVNKTYDGLTNTGGNGVTVNSGFINGDTDAQIGHYVYSGSSQTAINVGTYVIGGTALSGLGYALTYNTGTLTVQKANLTITGSKTYDAGTSIAGIHLTANGANGETFSMTGAGDISNLSSKNVQTSSTLASLTGLNLGSSTNGGLSTNYNALSTTGSSVNVTAKTASVTATATALTYNGTTQNQAAEIHSGFITGDNISVTGLASGINASTYTSNLQVSGTDASNYSVAITNADLVIDKANLTLAGTRAYDGGTTFAGTHLTATGVHGETFTVTGAGDTSNLSSKNVQTGSTLNTVTGLALGTSSNGGLSTNYNALNTAGSNVNVTAKTASVSATATTLTYNGTTQHQTTETTTGFITGDSINITGQARGKSANTYSSNLQVGGSDATNYNVTITNADLVIGRAALTVTANQITKTYDSYLTASGSPSVGALAGANAGEVVNNTGAQAFLDANAGTSKIVRASGVTVRDANYADVSSNYNITYIDNNTSVINKAALTVKANNDARFVATGDAQGFNDVNYEGFVGGENSSVLGGTLTITRQNANTDVAAGTYTGVLVPSGLTSTNYDIRNENGDYTIVPARTLLIRSANQSLTYGSTPTYTTTAKYMDGLNVIHTLTQSGTGNTLTFNDGAEGSAAITLNPYVNTTLAASSSAGKIVVGNYEIKDTNPIVVGRNFEGVPVFIGNLTINTKALTPNASNVSKVYDATTSMNNVNLGLSGAIVNDKLDINGTGAFTQKNAGSNLSYTISNLVLTGDDARNYHLTGSNNSFTGTNGTITPAPLSLSTASITKAYDGNTTATGTLKFLLDTQLLGDDTISGATYAFTSAVSGVNKVVQVSGAVINDGNSGNNYAITYIDNTDSVILERNNISSSTLPVTGLDSAAYRNSTNPGNPFALTPDKLPVIEADCNTQGGTNADGAPCNGSKQSVNEQLLTEPKS